MKETFKPGGILSGQKFVIEDEILTYKNAYGKYARVKLKDIETISIEPKRMGSSIVKIIGKGTELANIELPYSWATKTVNWLEGEIDKIK